MGRLRRSRAHHARRDVHRAARTRVRTRDLDQIELDLHPANRARLEKQDIDEDKPGLGQHYCVECAKYYESELALQTHTKSKVHRRRLKEIKQGAYTIGESERAAGLGVDNTQRGVEEVVRRIEGMVTEPITTTATTTTTTTGNAQQDQVNTGQGQGQRQTRSQTHAQAVKA